MCRGKFIVIWPCGNNISKSSIKIFLKHEKWAVHNVKEGQENSLTTCVISWNQSSSCSKPMFCGQQKQAEHKSLTHTHNLLCPDNHMGLGSQQSTLCLRRIIRACFNFHGKQWKGSHWHGHQGMRISSGCDTTKVLKQDLQRDFYQKNPILKLGMKVCF